MDSIRLRSIILNLQDRLSNDDRKRLHFYLGNDVPRRIRDDPTLGGTLNLMDSLFDQDIINEKDFTYLIEAFHEIRCFDAVKLLKEHLNRSQSTQSLSLIMPPLFEKLTKDQEDDDKLSLCSNYICLQNFTNHHETTINNNQINQQILPKRSERKILSKQCLVLLLFLLSFGFCLIFAIWSQYENYKMKNNSKLLMEMIQQTKTNQTETILLWKQLQNLEKEVYQKKI
ncbi:unnamed protein product [Adineta ricciae]|uniref:DED domain-containing protein n=1 Tax=Adineta ricciae TaxID=249248 RepID=A0A815RB68_ADIRI|nr:unnamed protein product [Adineta ricciae]CAF1537045.1 unnamed protein product [Adineta ricciae]